jgi:hypothetical protein
MEYLCIINTNLPQLVLFLSSINRRIRPGLEFDGNEDILTIYQLISGKSVFAKFKSILHCSIQP